MRFCASSAALLISCLLCGCTGDDTSGLPKTVNASGAVTLDGSPVVGASIVFVQPEGTYTASAASGKGGEFSLNAFEAKTGAVPGTYKVMVSRTIEVDAGNIPVPKGMAEDAQHAAKVGSANIMWKNDLPAKYASIGSSGLNVEIPDSGISTIKLELSSKP